MAVTSGDRKPMTRKATNPISAQLRRIAAEINKLADVIATERTPVKVGNATYDRAAGTITAKRKKPLSLTHTQAAILDTLVDNRGALVTRDEMMVVLYGEAGKGLITRTVDNQIAVLRKILGDESIKTIHTRGWQI